MLDAGHFALDTNADEIGELVRQFVKAQREESVIASFAS